MSKKPTGTQFIQARTMLNLTQREVAKRTGYSQTEISNIENGKSTKRLRIWELKKSYERYGISFGPNGMQVFLGTLTCDSIEAMNRESIDREKKAVRNRVAPMIRLKKLGMHLKKNCKSRECVSVTT